MLLYQHRIGENHKILITEAKVISRENDVFVRRLLGAVVFNNSNTFNNNKMSRNVGDFILNSLKLVPKYKKVLILIKSHEF